MLISRGKSIAWGPYFKKASCSPRLWTPWLLTLTWLLPWRASLSYPMAMTAMVRTLGTCLDPHNFYCHSSIEASILGQLSIDFLYAPHIICSFGMFWGFIMVAVGEVAKKGELTAPGFLTPNVSLTKPCSGTQEGVCHTFPI